MLNVLMCLSIILNLTGLFRFVAYLSGVNIWVISLVILFVNSIYIIYNRYYFDIIFSLKDIKLWIFFIFVWPILTLLYSPFFVLNDVALIFNYTVILISTIIFIISNDLFFLKRILFMSLIISFIGLLLSFLFPDYLSGVVSLAGAVNYYSGRAFGFELQPNASSASILLIFVAFYYLCDKQNTSFKFMFFILLILMLLLTGSRTGLTIGMLIFLIEILYNIVDKFRYNIPSFLLTFNKTVVYIMIFVAIIVTVNQYSYISRDISRNNLSNRIYEFFSFDFYKNTSNGYFKNMDRESRFGAQVVYSKLIRERPFFGYGLGFESSYLSSKKIYLSSHSSAISHCLEFGLFYPVLFLFLMLNLYSKTKNKIIYRNHVFCSLCHFSFVVIVYYTVNNIIIDSRHFYIILGLYIYIANHSKIEQKLNGI